MNLSPDPRQLKTNVTLSILNAPESGFFSGEYSASSATKAQDNLAVLNYDFNPTYTDSEGNTEPKYSTRLKVLSSLQNARIPEVNTSISASSCTFAWGSIAPDEVDPFLNLLKGPSAQLYDPVFIGSPNAGTVTAPADQSTPQFPKIPFTGEGNTLVTYNIWNTVNPDLTPTTKEAYKYIGPAIKGKNTGTLRTIKDPTYGAQVEVTSIKTVTKIMRYFPTSFDAVYQTNAEIVNPDGNKQPILARGTLGNNGFHINFSISNFQESTSSITVLVAGGIPDKNNDFINSMVIIFELNKKPVIKIYDPDTNQFLIQTDIIAPVLDSTTMSSYDLFVHFAGPNMLIGFSPDITKWNTVINFSGREVYFNPATSISMTMSNCNLKFRYSAIIFNNYNNDQPANSKENYIIAEFKYSGSKIPDVKEFIRVVKEHFEKAAYMINASPRSTGFNESNPKDKNISYFKDFRLDAHQFSDVVSIKFPNYTSADTDRKTVYFKLIYNTTIEGPAFLQIEVPHPGILAAEGVANLNSGNKGETDYKFVNPVLNKLFYDVGNVTGWVDSWSVSCQAVLSNLSRITKSATITLKNIDSEEGYKFINAIENNLLVVTIDAGYVQGSLSTYFQGFITNSSYSRKGNDSTFTLTCQDLASFILDNIYFDKNILLAGMRHDLAIDSIMACSGFWSYYVRNDKDAITGKVISGIDLRLNSSSTNNQDLIKLNPLDKIYDKLGKLLERLNNPYSLPTFRWAEKFGFILDCRNNYIDKDLKFTGLNPAGTQYLFQSNESNSKNYLAKFQTDLHGLLVDEYTITTDIKNLAAGVRVFGTAITGFLADERYSPASVSLQNVPIEAQLGLLKYLAKAPFDATQAPYVGFKKYLMWATQRNEIPDQQVLKRITDSVELVSKTPISAITFTCYVTKPLTFHGKFMIKVFQGQDSNFTDQYVYQSIDYTYDKNNNLITANVRGTNMPISLGGV